MGAAENVLVNTDQRLIYISDDINNASIGKICFNLLSLIKEDDENEKQRKDFKRVPIQIYVNSYGGQVYDMWGLIDIIEKSKTPVYTYCTGCAMSAAFNIFIAGHKRFATRHATFMYHQTRAYKQGTYQDLTEELVELDNVERIVEEYVIERTTLTWEFLTKVREKKQDVYFRGDDAVKAGIVDEII